MDDEIIDKKPKGTYPFEIKKLFNLLKFDERLPDIMGSASLTSMRYFGDYDLFSYIGFPSMNSVYNRMSVILESIINSNEYYFVEFKIQGVNGRKFRWFYGQEFLKRDFEKIVSDVKIDFMKIDIVVWIDNKFVEVSSIYKFGEASIDANDERVHMLEQLKSIREEIPELKADKNYYKILKRFYSIAKINEDDKMINTLTKFFNSDVGKMYADYSNILAINRLIEQRDSNPIIGESMFRLRLKNNLKILSKNSGRDIKDIDQMKKLENDLFKEINLKAEEFISKIKLRF